MDMFLEKYNAQNLAEDDRENLNYLIAIESVTKNIPTKRTPHPEDVKRESCPTFREK